MQKIYQNVMCLQIFYCLQGLARFRQKLHILQEMKKFCEIVEIKFQKFYDCKNFAEFFEKLFF